VCAANLADKYSIAGALGTTNKTGFWANVFNGVAGNTVSGFVLAVHPGQGNKWRAATSINNLTLQGTGKAINAVTTPLSVLDLGIGAESAETAAASFVGEGLGSIVFGIKLAYDTGSYLVAYHECGY
jgi:hypothetical protein